MILLKKLKTKNFLSHEDTTIDFNSQFKILIDGVSGSGKSSIAEAVTWCIYGKGRVDNTSLITSGKSYAEVSLDLVEDEQTYRIIRHISPSKHTITVLHASDKMPDKFNPVNVSGIRETQEWIDDFIHASYHLFINSVASPQNSNEVFVLQPASKRKDILVEIMGIHEIEGLYESSKKLLSKEELSAETTRSAIEVKSASLTTLKNDLKYTDIEVMRNALKLKANNLGSLVSVRDRLNGLLEAYKEVSRQAKESDDSLAETHKLIDLNRSFIENANSIITSTTTIDQEEINKKKVYIASETYIKGDRQRIIDELKSITELKWEMGSLIGFSSMKEKQYDRDLASLNSQYNKLTAITHSCPSGDECPFTKPFKAQIADLTLLIESKKSEKEKGDEQEKKDNDRIDVLKTQIPSEEYIERLNQELKRKESTLVTIESYKSVLASQDESAKTINRLKEDVKIKQGEIDTAEKKYKEALPKHNQVVSVFHQMSKDIEELAPGGIQKVLNDIGDISHDVYLLQNSISSYDILVKKITDLDVDIKKDKESLDIKNRSIKALSAVKLAMGDKGIKTVAIDYFVPKLEEKINSVLSKVSEMSVELETQRDSADGNSKIEGVFINIRNNQGEVFDFDSYSGGEKIKVVLSISEALASFQRVGFRILDEAFLGLDETSIDGFVYVMAKLQTSFPQLLCISHIQSIKDMFDEKIQVTKINGISKITNL